MDIVSIIRSQSASTHEWFEATMAEVTPEVAHWQPGGTAHPIASLYAHAVTAEDIMTNMMIQGGQPLFTSSWSGKTGISDPSFDANLEWARSVRIDLDQARAYAQAVYDSTDAYLAGLGADDLSRTIDLTEQGMGEWSLGAFLISFVIGHMRDMMGEISALKGIQGLQGYPF